MDIKIVYWPKGGSVEKVSKMLSQKMDNHKVDVFCVEDVDIDAFSGADLLIMGGSTVGADHWENSSYQDVWATFFSQIKTLEGQKVALFGLGNQVLYPAHFVDSMKDLADLLAERGATLVGACSREGYDFEASKALVDGQFIGLPLDEDTQAGLTAGRLEAWIKLLGL